MRVIEQHSEHSKLNLRVRGFTLSTSWGPDSIPILFLMIFLCSCSINPQTPILIIRPLQKGSGFALTMFIAIARICRYLRFRILDLVSETKSRNEGALNFRPMPGTLSKARWAKEQSGGMTRGWAVELGGERVRTFFGLGRPKFLIHIELLSLWLVVA